MVQYTPKRLQSVNEFPQGNKMYDLTNKSRRINRSSIKTNFNNE